VTKLCSGNEICSTEKSQLLDIAKRTMVYSLIRIFCQASEEQRHPHDYLHDKLIVLMSAERNYDATRQMPSALNRLNFRTIR